MTQPIRHVSAAIISVNVLVTILVLIQDLGGAYVYLKLDVQWGYNNIQIKEGDKWKAAFKTK